MSRLYRCLVLLISIGLVNCVKSVSGQTLCLLNSGHSAAAPEYAVASVRQSSGIAGMALRETADGYSARNVTLWALLFNAYSLRPGDPLSGLPGWATALQFDVEAKMDSADADAMQKLSPEDRERQRRAMLQAILKGRFGLQAHYVTKVRPVYALILARNGFKLNRLPDNAPGHGSSWGEGQINVREGSIADFAFYLSDIVGREVVDRTGVHGKYDISLKWAPDESKGDAGDGPTIFTALQEQLGLRLVPTKAPVDTLVVDHIEKPSEN